jgi:Glycine-zipper domain
MRHTLRLTAWVHLKEARDMTRRLIVVGCAMLFCSGCVTTPTGPMVKVMPGPEKSFEQFQTDDAVCRQWSLQQAGNPQTAAVQGTTTGAAIGTLVGAGLGAAIGAVAGHPGTGAAIGAGGGLLGGTALGINAGQSATFTAQRRYDRAYEQCMYAKGNDTPREPMPGPPPRQR